MEAATEPPPREADAALSWEAAVASLRAVFPSAVVEEWRHNPKTDSWTCLQTGQTTKEVNP